MRMKGVLLLSAFAISITCGGVPVVSTVQDVPGYNSWPMVQALGQRLVCAYSRGTAHWIEDPVRGVFVRHSDDGGRTWSPETKVVDYEKPGEVTITGPIVPVAASQQQCAVASMPLPVIVTSGAPK